MLAASREQRVGTEAACHGRDFSFVASTGFISPLCQLSPSGMTGKKNFFPDLEQ